MLSAEGDYWYRRVAVAGCRGIPVVEPGVAGQVIRTLGLAGVRRVRAACTIFPGHHGQRPGVLRIPARRRVGIVISGGHERGLRPTACPPGPSRPVRCVEFHGMVS